MSESEVQPNIVGSNRSKNVYNLSIALAPHLGIPTDVIEQALIKAIEQNSANIVNALPSPLHKSIQESKPVGDLSQSTAFLSPGSNHDVHPSHLDIGSKNHITQESSSQSYKKNRKDSLSSLIEITQNGSTSINIKLPSLHVPPPTVQGEMTNGQNNPRPFDENLNRPQYYEQNIYNGSNNEQNRQDFSKEYISSQRRDDHVQDTSSPEDQIRQIDSDYDVFKEYIPQRSQDKYKVPNRNQQVGSDVSKEFIRRQSDLQANRFQDTYNSPEIQAQRINSAPEEYIPPQRREFQDSHRKYPQVVSPIKNNPSETYLSEFPSLSEVTKKSDSKKNSGVDLGAWGQMDFASAWGKPRKWKSETEMNTSFEPPANTSTWNPDSADLTWKPIQEPRPPINKKKPPNSFDLDDTEGWGTPPANAIPWDDDRQGYCVDLIEEQKETVFWSMQNGNWVNVSEEYSITSEKTVEYSTSGFNHRQTRTQTQRIERHGIDNGATRDEETRHDHVRKERSLVYNETTEDTANSIIVELTDHSNDNSDSSETENYRSNSDTATERLGNPQWKSENEWGHNPHDSHNSHNSHNSQSKKEVDLINLDMHDISESKGSEEELTSDREVNGEEVSNWNNWRSEKSPKEVNDDAWFTEDVQEQQEDMIKRPDQDLLINIDSNCDNEVTESTIINTHPPIFHGRVNNEMAEDLNDILFNSSTNPANTTSVDTVNNELNLLSFDDDENKVSNSSAVQENNKNNSINCEEIETFLRDNNYKPPEEIENSNELQDKAPISPYVINMNYDNNNEKSDVSHNSSKIDSFSFAPPSRSYRCENSSQVNIESMNSSSTIDINEHDQYRQVPDQFELDQCKGSVDEPQDATDPNSNETNSNSITNSKDFIINLTVETPSNGRQILRLRYDDDPQIAATEFCRKWNMFHFEDALKGFVQKEQKRKIRKRRTKCKK